MSVLRRSLLVLSLSLTASLAGSPMIISITPDSGPASGGTTVVIKGTGFSNNCVTCSPPFGPPRVLFDGLDSPEVKFIDSNTLEAVTPPHVPASVHVTVVNLDGSHPDHHRVEGAFTYTGDVLDAYEPILFPIFMPPVRGAHGSEFHTTAKIWNKSEDQPVTYFGYDHSCSLASPAIYRDMPSHLGPRMPQAQKLWPECSDSVGRLLWVPKGDKNVAASLRVWEISTQSQNHGVEIPVLRLEDFSQEIALVDVPTDPKFRLTLRVYGLNRGEELVNLWFGSGSGICCGDTWDSVQLRMEPGEEMFVPSYAVFTDFRPADGFPPFPETINVLVQSPDGKPIWAFITVTNNETQHITTVTPQH